MIGDLLNLLFPNLCISCNASLSRNERHLCVGCLIRLPETQHHLTRENSVEKTLWGRIPFERAFSFLYFNQKGTTQKLLHELKYKGNEELAHFLGEMYANKIRKTVEYHGINAIVAIPLHKMKMAKRGYNQSLAFANGMAKQLPLENLSDYVSRKKNTDTQTKKSRIDRWDNVNSVFAIQNLQYFENKHILVVDDVITTGATIESCASEITKSVNCRISIASIAYAA